MNITSPAAARYVVVVDSGGLSKAVVSTLAGSAMTSGVVTVPVPAGSGYRVRVAAVDSIPGYGNSIGGVVATGATSGVSATAGSTTTATVTAVAPSFSRAPAVTAVNNPINALFTITEQGKFLSETSHCAYVRSSPTAFPAVSLVGTGTCLGQNTLSATTTQWSATLAAPTSTGTLYTNWFTLAWTRA